MQNWRSRLKLGRCPQGVSKPGQTISGRLDWNGLREWSKLVGSEDWTRMTLDVSKETN